MGQGGDDDVVRLPLPDRACTDAAVPGLVHAHQVGGRRDDLGLGRVVRPAHVLAQVGRGGLRVVEQPYAGADHLGQVVRRDVGGHADRDAGGAVEQQVRQPRGHPRGLFQRAVEVGHPVHRPVRQLAQQHLRDRCKPRLGVAHRRERLGVVGGAEVALPLDQRVAVRERLRHQHHRLVRGTVAVWVVLADHVADGARGLLGLGAGVEAELAHRVDDPPLHRLQAVADEGQGAVEDHVHRIVEVGAFGVLAKRDLLEAVEVGTYGLGHAGSVTWIAVARGRARNQRIDRTRRVRVRPSGTGHSMRSPT